MNSPIFENPKRLAQAHHSDLRRKNALPAYVQAQPKRRSGRPLLNGLGNILIALGASLKNNGERSDDHS